MWRHEQDAIYAPAYQRNCNRCLDGFSKPHFIGEKRAIARRQEKKPPQVDRAAVLKGLPASPVPKGHSEANYSFMTGEADF